MARYAGGALLFSFVYASIQYSQGNITDLKVLASHIFIFVVLGTAISGLVAFVIKSIRNIK
jgi:hypothetical protein